VSRDIDWGDIDPGIRDVVRFVRSLGFDTTDSGDGVSKGEGGAPWPHAFAVVPKGMLTTEADRLYRACVGAGLGDVVRANAHSTEECNDHAYVYTSYDPVDGVAVVGLVGVNDTILRAATMAPSNDDIPRDEMLLAELFARWDDNRQDGIVQCSSTGTCWLCAVNALDGDGQQAGFRHLDPQQCGLDAGEMDDYAAGLAFVTALEDA
jgi:hypothetical protein